MEGLEDVQHCCHCRWKFKKSDLISRDVDGITHELCDECNDMSDSALSFSFAPREPCLHELVER